MDSSVQLKSPHVIDKSQMWKEKDADLQNNDNVHVKVWESGFKVAAEMSSPIGKPKVDDKMLPMPTTTNANGDKVFR